jgi:hypothetical protein
MLTKDSILHMLQTDKRAVARALVVLYARQTDDEQAQEGTRYLNGRGFRPCHARMGSSMAKYFQRTGMLTDKQIAYWRATDKSGAMRIGIYWAQLLEEAELKSKAKQVVPVAAIPASLPEEPERDYGNDMERRMVLQEQYDDVLDSDDEKLYGPIKEELDELDAYWKKLRNINKIGNYE